MNTVTMHMFLVALVLAALSAACGGPPYDAVQLAEKKALVEGYIQEGAIVRYSCTDDEALFAPWFWRSINADTKRGAAITLSNICDSQDEGDAMTILDAQSGQRLARYRAGNFQAF